VHGLNPYIVTPDTLVGNPLLPWIYDDWRSLASPYGPLWTTISAAMAPWTYRLDISDQVLLHKLFMNVVQVVNLVLMAWLLKRSLPHVRGARLTAFVLFAWNPLLLLEIAGNGHNDGLMLTLLLAGLVPIARLTSATANQPRRVNLAWLAGMLLLCLSVLVKYATLLIGIFSTVIWARELRNWRTRGFWVGGTLLLISLVGLATYWPWLAGPQMLSPAFDEINGKFQFHSVPVLLQRLIGEWLPSITDLEPADAAITARNWTYGLARLMFVLYLGWELKRLWTSTENPPAVQAICAASARALLIALLLVLTEVHSWYFTWPLALVTLLGWRSRLTQLVVGYTLTCLPVDYVALFDFYATVPIPVRVVLGLAYLGLPLIIPVAMSMRRVSEAFIRNRQRARMWALADLP
jgi:alpha-1,6-mannosyltransferase